MLSVKLDCTLTARLPFLIGCLVLCGASTTLRAADWGDYAQRLTDGYRQQLSAGAVLMANDIYLEAECAQLGADWAIVPAAGESNGHIIECPEGVYLNPGSSATAASTVIFNFDAAVAGPYSIYLRTFQTTTGNDSYWVRLNGGTWYKFNDVPRVAGYEWWRVWNSDNGGAYVDFPVLAGPNVLEISYREHSRLDKVLITDAASAPAGHGAATGCGTSFIEDIYVEAECGTLGADWTVVSDPSAGNGSYIESPNNYNGSQGAAAKTATYTVQVTRAGARAIYARNITPTGGTDSHWIRVNGDKWYEWNNQPASNDLQWKRAWDTSNGDTPIAFPFVVGENTIEISQREYSRIDKLFVTNRPATPAGPGDPVGCSTAGVNEIYLEAEQSFVGAAWTVTADAGTGSGAYVQYAAGNLNAPSTDTTFSLIYDVPVQTAATYRLFGYLDAPSGTSDSYWVRIDDGAWLLFRTGTTAGWAWSRVNDDNAVVDFTLAAGHHRIEVQPREASRLDRLLLTDAMVDPATAGSGGVNVDMAVPTQVAQPLYLRQYRGISGGSFAALEAHPGYPGAPDTVFAMNGFSTPAIGEDLYGGLTEGYLIPPTSGFYQFNVCADDDAELWVSTNDLTDHLVETVSTTQWAAPGDHDKYPEQTSTLRYLEAGRAYAVRARYFEGTGGDHLYVYWKTPGSSTWQLIDGTALAPAVPREICDNGLDDDGDGLFDGQDDECQALVPGTGQNGNTTIAPQVKWWRNVSPANLSGLTGKASYPTTPDTIFEASGALSVGDLGEDNVGGRMRGFVIPSQSGPYRFNFTADDQGYFQLSPNDDFANLTPRGNAPGWIPEGDHNKYPEQTSNYVYLAKDSLYAFEMVFVDAIFGGHGAVYWQTPDNPSTWQLIPAANLAADVGFEICDNGIDDDGDFLIDGADPDCMSAPMLADDRLEGCPGAALSLDLLSNDANVNANRTITVAQAPTAGSAVISAAGVLSYTPAGNVCGIDELLYSVCNGGIQCDTARVVLDNNDDILPAMSWRHRLAGGQTARGGILQNVALGYTPVTFPEPFAAAPVVLVQPVSDYGATPLSARVRNVTTAGFELLLQTEEAGTATALAETVAWVAFATGAGPARVVGTTGGLVDETGHPFTFGQSFTEPILLATDQSIAGTDPGNLRLDALTATGATLRFGEETSADTELAHASENVGYVVLEAGLLRDAAGQVIGEAGSLDLSQSGSSFAKVYTQYEYHRPVVLVSPPTANDTDPVTARVRGLSTKSFEIGLQEWAYQDGLHGTETLQFLILETAAPINQVADCGSAPAQPAAADLLATDNCSTAPTLTPSSIACDDTYVAFYVKNDSIRYILPQQDVPTPANAGASISNLLLTSMCSDDPSTDLRWRVRNANPFPVFVETVDIYYVPQNGGLLAPANTDIYFFTKREGGSNTVRIHWRDQNGTLKSTTKSSGYQTCGNALDVQPACLCADTYRYDLSDACGNTKSYVQVQYLIDRTGPTFTVPADLTIRCDEDMDDLDLTGRLTNVQDACVLGAFEATYTDTLTTFDPITQVRTFTRYWTQKDGCGNKTKATQLITVSACVELPGNGTDDTGNTATDCADPYWQALGATVEVPSGAAQYPDSLFTLVAGEPGYRHYVIPVGWYYTGAMDRLFFALDDDNAPKDGDAYFANLKVYEKQCGGCAPLQLDGYPIGTYDPAQDFGQVAFTEGGYGIRMWNNAWKSIDFNYNITPNTVLEFDYRATVEAEIHAIGFDNDSLQQSDRAFQLHGTQTYGSQDFSFELPTYTWSFGPGASVATATGPGPHQVSYAASGIESPTLTLSQSGCSQTVAQTLTVYDQSDALDDDVTTGCPGVVVTSNVLTNDYLVPGTHTLTVIDSTDNGTVTLLPGGKFEYQPYSFTCTTDSFSYRLCEPLGYCDVATVRLLINDNQGPTITNLPPALDSIFCDESIPVAASVSLIDNCPGIGLAYAENDNKGSSGCSRNNYRLERNWTAIDACGNQSSYAQELFVFDQTAPDLYRIHTLPGGGKMIGGVMENVTQRWKRVRFPLQFAAPPVVLPQLASRNELGAARVRIRKVTQTGFEMRLLEEKNADQRHGSEDVSWVALETGAAAGSHAARRDTLNVINGEGKALVGGFGANTQIFGAVQTNAYEEVTNLRQWNATASAVNLRLDDPKTAESRLLTYSPEVLGLLELPEGPLYNAAGERIGEVGSLTASHIEQSVSLAHVYNHPVVVTGVLTRFGGAPAATRLTSVTDSTFSVFVQELDYDDGYHATETIPYLVLEGNLPASGVVGCAALPAPLTLNDELRAVDNGDLTTSITFMETTDDTDCDNWTVRRDYFVTDACNNSYSTSYTLTVVDSVAPTFTVPADITIPCGYDRSDLLLTGSPGSIFDACDAAPLITYSDDSSAVVNCTGNVYRLWTLTDRCQNTRLQTQRIFILNNTDTDNDGTPDALDLDSDNDGHADLIEGTYDADGDGIPNHLDLDSDNDGITDLLEGGHTDFNGDGVVDNFMFLNWDKDGDGLAVQFDGDDNDTSLVASLTMDLYNLQHDRDQDGVPNMFDLDSDNDGLTDLLEAGGVDEDGDGRIDWPDPYNPYSLPDADFDGYADYYDPDSDFVLGTEMPMRPLLTYNNVAYTAGMMSIPVDFDLDGVPNIWDLDSDNDGIPDLIESGGVDVNGDGRIDLGTEFADTNSNGLHDNYEQSPLLRSDPDGSLADGRPQDTDATGSPYALADADQDAFPNSLDADADNDGRSDLVEVANAPADTDHDGRLDAFIDSNSDGMDDAAAASGRIATEVDGTNDDGRPSDSGDADQSPYTSTLPAGTLGDLNGDVEVDKDGDGLPNFLDTDADNDGLPDSLEDPNGDGHRSSGETDSYDADTDDDLLIDGIEDANQDGTYTYDETDPRKWDTDGDTLGDGQEDTNLNGTVQPDESDPRDPCDPNPSGACIGIRLAPRILLQGALLDNNGALMRDDLRKRNVIPLLSPYLDGVTVDTTVLQVSGPDAIVDWVLLELRDHTDPTIVVARQSVLLQRDGDVVDVDGTSAVYFPLLFPGDFYVALNHRNHLGIMGANSYYLNPVATPIDFTKLSTPLYVKTDNQAGEPARNYNGQRVLWSGNLNGDGRVVFQGPGNEIAILGLDIFAHPNNVYYLANFVAAGYYNTDTNLDGTVILQGPKNDRNPVLFHTVFQTPFNTSNSANYSVYEQLPTPPN